MTSRTVVPTALAQRVQQLRRSRGLTQLALAQRANVDRQTLGAIERGEESCNPTLRVLVSLCEALNVSPAELFIADRGAA